MHAVSTFGDNPGKSIPNKGSLKQRMLCIILRMDFRYVFCYPQGGCKFELLMEKPPFDTEVVPTL